MCAVSLSSAVQHDMPISVWKNRVPSKTSQDENESGVLLGEHRHRYVPCERQTRNAGKNVWNSTLHVAAAPTTNTIKHTGDENVVYVNS